jgi:hypothetical protein
VHPAVLKLVHPSAHASLERVVQRDVEAILGCVTRAGALLDGPAYAAAVEHHRGEAELAPEAVRFAREADRAAALATRPPFAAFTRTWDARAFAGPDLVPDPDPRAELEFVEDRERILEQTSDAAGLTRHVLNAAVVEANRLLPAGLPLTDDFLLFVPGDDDGTQLIANLRLAAPDPVAARLREQGLLPDRMTELEGFFTDPSDGG